MLFQEKSQEIRLIILFRQKLIDGSLIRLAGDEARLDFIQLNFLSVHEVLGELAIARVHYPLNIGKVLLIVRGDQV